MGGVSIAKWGNHYKEEQGSTKGYWHLSFRATIPKSKTIVIAKSCVEVWYQTMDIVQSSRFFKKNSINTKYVKKQQRCYSVLCFGKLASHTNVQFKSYLSIPGCWHLHTCKMLKQIFFFIYWDVWYSCLCVHNGKTTDANNESRAFSAIFSS